MSPLQAEESTLNLAHPGLTSLLTGIIVYGSIPSIIATEKSNSPPDVNGDPSLVVKTLHRNGYISSLGR